MSKFAPSGRTDQKRIATHPLRDERRERARLRQEARDARSPQEQLDLLATRGITSGREFDRLTAAA